MTLVSWLRARFGGARSNEMASWAPPPGMAPDRLRTRSGAVSLRRAKDVLECLRRAGHDRVPVVEQEDRALDQFRVLDHRLEPAIHRSGVAWPLGHAQAYGGGFAESADVPRLRTETVQHGG